MKKRDIQTRNGKPAINVKCYFFPTFNQVVEEFNCSGDVAEKALEFAWESAVEGFWQDIKEVAEFYFTGRNVEVWQDGRSGGWLYVDGLPDIESWDAIQVSQWSRFVKSVKEDIKYRASWESVKEMIEANEWTKEGSEKYNFVDTPSGVKCLADLNAEIGRVKKEFLTT